MKLIIPGNPTAQKRHRSVRRGNLIIQYDPDSQEKKGIEHTIKEQQETSIECSYFESGCDITCNITFYLPIPKSWPKSKVIHFNEIPHVVKPDCDNLAKKYLDCMTGIIYRDDCQITNLFVCKKYSKEPRTEIDVYLTKKDQS